MIHISWEKAEKRLQRAVAVLNDGTPSSIPGPLHVGIDLGTSDVVLLVVDGKGNPVAAFLEWAEVVRDGVVVDFLGASQIVEKLKQKAEKKLGLSITSASTSFPPGTDARLSTNILENIGLEVLKVADEPSCIARLLDLDKTAVVDVGGGTTGTAVVQEKEVVFSDDEPTGGTHISLVIAGHFNISFDEAERYKRKSEKYGILHLAKPTFQRICDIVKKHIENHQVDTLLFAGGTCSLPGLKPILEKEMGKPVLIPNHPLLLTPLAIASLNLE
ncbi:MAG: ethanolamine utilization protein EutJ [Desulfotignum sp.]|jgi:ethanolamine utilization protein EutJ|nr:ethanolamine utilization protein EutJ [Desulfotignum sp.]